MALCWRCSRSEYHDYKDKHGIRCPLCGQKEKDDPNKVKVSEIRLPVKEATNPPVKRAPTRRSK